MSSRTIADMMHVAPPVERVAGKLPSSTNVGIEVELEGYNAEPVQLNYWRAVNDGSLRNGGIEFVFATPLSGHEDIHSALTELDTMLSSTTTDLSHRTSVHFHIDFSRDTLDTLENFFMIYMLAESVVYTLGGKDRYANIYCPGLTHATEQIKDAAATFLSEKALLRGAPQWCKYSGINLKTLARFGTVEIRNHEGTQDIMSLYDKVALLLRMKELAKSMTWQEINNIATPLRWAELLEVPDYAFTLDTYWEAAQANRHYYHLCQMVCDEVFEQTRKRDAFLEALDEFI